MADKRISQLIERVDIANNDVLPIVASGATTTNKVTVSTLQTWMQDNLDVGVTSVGLSMPSAFVVSNSPVTASGNISVTGAGTVSQYIRGDGSLADFPSGGGGGGSSVNYYLNGSVSQGTIGGIAYQEMNRTPILGAGTDFTIAADGYIASFITDAGDPALLEIPAGNWNFETYLQASSGGGTPSFYIELYKVDSGGTATLIASNSGTPELIAFGTTTTPYFSALAVPTTSLALTDRLALRYYVTHSGRTITLHTENATLCQIITTFTTGLTALNGLTAQVQNFATGTSGTNFGISSTGSTHTFNLPTASATNRGALSSADWSSFNGKVPYTGAVANVDLGSYSITANAINSAGSGSTAGQINLRSDAFFSLVNGYGSIASGTTNQFNLYQTTGAGVFRGAILSLNSITASATRTYTLPDASGTLALSTDLGAYLPLTGGTLTGALNGTSASFTGSVSSSRILLGGATANSYRINLSANSDTDTAGILMTDTNIGGRSYSIGSSITTIGNLEFRDNTAGANRLTISSTGAATFSSSVTSSFGSGGANFNSNAGTTGSVNAYRVSHSNGIGSFGLEANAGGDLMIGGLANATLLQSVSNTPLQLGTNQTARLSILANGNVGIGTASPSWMLEVNKDTASSGTGQYPVVSVNNPNASGFSALYFYQGATQKGGLEYSNGNNSLSIIANSATRMQITSGGDVLVGATSIPGAGSSTIGVSLIPSGAITAQRNAATVGFFGRSNDGELFAFYRGTTQVGNISVTSVLTTYNTTSDYRLKEDLQQIKGLEKVQAIKVYDYQWKGTETRMDGVLAHELAEVLPYAVHGEKDELDEDGNDKMQGVDYSKIVPILIKAIQEQQEQIDSLKNQMQ